MGTTVAGEILRQARRGARPTLSFEMFPPKGTLTLEKAREIAGEMAACEPDFVSVTCSAGGGGNGADGVTGDIAAMIQNEFRVPAVAHLTCVGATAEGIERSMADLRARGVGSVLALRGDLPEGEAAPAGAYRLACDLIPVLKEHGFCVGAAAYPEGHITCSDARVSMNHLKAKQEAGADFLVTQLAFDNEDILRFVDRARRARVTVPIVCGVMPFLSKAQITRMVFLCGASLPSPVIKLLARYEHDEAALAQAGIEYACEQLEGLVREGVDGVHIYAMNRPSVARAAAAAMERAKAQGVGRRSGAGRVPVVARAPVAGMSGGRWKCRPGAGSRRRGVVAGALGNRGERGGLGAGTGLRAGGKADYGTGSAVRGARADRFGRGAELPGLARAGA